jgi:hypothetical protein
MRTRTLAPIVGAFIAGSLITWAAVSHEPPASVSSSAPITRPLLDWPPVTVTVPTTVTATPTIYGAVADELHWTDGVAVCLSEDGSTPGQSFPCRWEAAHQGNGQGETYTLDGPA